MNLAGLAFVPQGMQDFQTRATNLAQAQLDLDQEKRALQAQSGAAAGWLTPDGQAAAPSRAALPGQGVAGGSAGPAPGSPQYGGGGGAFPQQQTQGQTQPQMINGVPVNPGALPGSAGSSMTGPDAPPGQSAGAPSLRPVDPRMAQQGGQGGPGMGSGPQAGVGQPGMPQGAPGAPPGAGGTGGQPGQGGLTSADPRATLRSIAQQIKQANPNMDNKTLFQAVAQTVGLMGKFAPEERLMLNAQIQIARIQQQADAALTRSETAR